MSTTNRAASRTAAKPRRQRAWWQSPIVFAMAFLAIALGIAAALNAGGDDDTTGGGTTVVSETSAAEILGPPLPPFANPDTGVGAIAPSFSAATFAGDPETVTPDGTARLIGFFAHWCPHCQDEMPVVSEYLRSTELPEGVEVLAISTGVNTDGGNYPPSAWFDRESWPATVLADSAESAIANGYGLTGYPYWVAIDGDGRVIYRAGGQLGLDTIQAIVDTLADTESTS